MIEYLLWKSPWVFLGMMLAWNAFPQPKWAGALWKKADDKFDEEVDKLKGK